MTSVTTSVTTPATATHAARRDIPADWEGVSQAPLHPDEAFNGFVVSNVVLTMDRLGWFERLENRSAAVSDMVGEPVLAAEGLLRVATDVGLVRSDGNGVELTESGRQMARMRGYFTWLVGGYSEVFRDADAIITGTATFGEGVRRDEGMVARGSAQNDTNFLAPVLSRALEGIELGDVADLGSGTCERLSRLVARTDESTGLGIDISHDATRLAKERVAQLGMSDRVRPVQGDALSAAASPELRGLCAEVDTVISFFLLHDLLADPAGRSQVFPRLRSAFPGARRFVLADTTARDEVATGRLPIFSAAFELAHALMGVPVHPRETYLRLFAAAGLQLEQEIPFGTPYSYLWVLRPEGS